MNTFLTSTIVRYLISGAVATVVDIASLYFLVDMLHLWYLASATIAFVLTVIVSFMMQKFWTFQETSTESIHTQIRGYLILSTANIFINTALMYLFVSLFHIQYLIAQLGVIAVISLYGFFIYKYLIFRVR